MTNCPNCGAPLPDRWRGRCEYCGTAFKRPHDYPENAVIIQEDSRPIVLQVKTEVDDEVLSRGPQGIGDYVLRDMRHQLAEQLAQLMEVDKYPDRENCKTVFRGRVRALPPGFRFGEDVW